MHTAFEKIPARPVRRVHGPLLAPLLFTVTPLSHGSKIPFSSYTVHCDTSGHIESR